MKDSSSVRAVSQWFSVAVLAFVVSIGVSACDQVVSKGASMAPMAAPAVDAPVEQRSVTLDLIEVELKDDLWTVDVFYNRSADQEAPRVMELQLALGDGLVFHSALAGEALERADKDLVAQARDEGIVRLVAFASTNVAHIESGVIARLVFRVHNAAQAEVTLLPHMPIFEPGGANQGLLLAEPLTLGGAE